MPEEIIATGSGAGAGVTPPSQGTDGIPQGTVQSQSTEPVKVEDASPTPSSTPQPGRSNIDWALQRHIEKAVKKSLQASLQESLVPLLERLNQPQVPPASLSPADEQPDYNDLSNWINRRVEKLLEHRLSQSLPKTMNQMKGELTSELKSETAIQEAKNYLLSQKDIGNDQQRLEEIRDIILNDKILRTSVEKEPLAVTQRASEIWRQRRVNPNAPPKAHLTGIHGGASSVQPKKEISIQELLAIQKKLSSNLTVDEREKLNAEVDALIAS